MKNQKQSISADKLTLPTLLESCAAEFEYLIAVVDCSSGQSYSYKQLANDVNILSKLLYLIVIYKSSKLIGVLSETSYIQIVAATAIMKIGCAYLPLYHGRDITCLDTILTEGGVKVVLLSRIQYEREVIRKQLEGRYTLVVVDALLLNLLNQDAIKRLFKNVTLPDVLPTTAAYVIFSSGTTAVPKGVTVNHLGVVNTIFAINNKYTVNRNDKVLGVSPFSFDLSVYDIFGLFAVVGAVVLPDYKQSHNSSHWVQLINQYAITLWNSTPQVAKLLISTVRKQSTTIKSVRLFLLSGDVVPSKLPYQIRQTCNCVKVVILGGATEASIWSSWYDVEEYSLNLDVELQCQTSKY